MATEQVYLSPKEYAQRWGLSYNFVSTSIHNGRLDAIQIGKHKYRIHKDSQIRPEAKTVIKATIKNRRYNFKAVSDYAKRIDAL